MKEIESIIFINSPKDVIALLIGLLISMGLGYFIGDKTMRILRIELLGRKKHHGTWLGDLSGIIERPMYVILFLLNKPEGIAFWLGLKVLGGWKSWSEEGEAEDEKGNKCFVSGRSLYNVFLLGSLLSVIYGALGGAIAYAIKYGEIRHIIFAFCCLGIIILLNHFWLNKHYLPDKKANGKLYYYKSSNTE